MKSYRPWKVAEGRELTRPERDEDGLTPSERVAIAGLHSAGWELPDLARLYAVPFAVVKRVTETTPLPYNWLLKDCHDE
jgi:hypothetical protein